MQRLQTRHNTRLVAFTVIAIVALLAMPFGLFQLQGVAQMNAVITHDKLKVFLDSYTGTQVPGLEYEVVDVRHTIFTYAGGWADIQRRVAMTPVTTLMAYSMSKTFTAAAILQLVERGRLRLDDPLSRYLPDTPYDKRITIRQLLDHTSGIPNPIPLKWVHLASEHSAFDEDGALAQVMRDTPQLDAMPGQRYGYSNIGYWLLGKVVERVSGQSFRDYMRANVFTPLGLREQDADYVIPDAAPHAFGYIPMFSATNLLKHFVMDAPFLGDYEGTWFRLNNHYLNGAAFGGLVTTASAVGRFLQDQLAERSVLFGPETKSLFYTRQSTSDGQAIDMTLGWHIGQVQGGTSTYFYKTGSGGGTRTEMRIYPAQGVASVILGNSSDFNADGMLNKLDAVFLPTEA